MEKFTDRILWKVKADVYGLNPLTGETRFEFHIQADDIDEALKLAKEYVPAKLMDDETYAIRLENLPMWDIDSIECVWHLADYEKPPFIRPVHFDIKLVNPEDLGG